MNNERFLTMMVHRLAEGGSRKTTNRERRRMQRISKKFPHHWVRTPNKVWKVFDRDENHKWRRWHGWPFPNNREGSWEYASDKTVAHHCIAALSPDPSTPQERAHD